MLEQYYAQPARLSFSHTLVSNYDDCVMLGGNALFIPKWYNSVESTVVTHDPTHEEITLYLSQLKNPIKVDLITDNKFIKKNLIEITPVFPYFCPSCEKEHDNKKLIINTQNGRIRCNFGSTISRKLYDIKVVESVGFQKHELSAWTDKKINLDISVKHITKIINQKYLIAAYESKCYDGANIFIKSPMGSGKSTLI